MESPEDSLAPEPEGNVMAGVASITRNRASLRALTLGGSLTGRLPAAIAETASESADGLGLGSGVPDSDAKLREAEAIPDQRLCKREQTQFTVY
jgi:hypothetical protein